MPATMEALRAAGLADAVQNAAPPGRPETTIVIGPTVAGPPWRSITQEMPDMSMFSPESMGLASQAAAERLLADRAAELGADLRFSTRLEAFSERNDGVIAGLRDLTTGAELTVHAEYAIAADGFKGSMRAAAGIGTHGRGLLEETTSLAFRADVPWDGAAVQMHYLQNSGLPGGSASFISTDEPGRYVLGTSLSADAGEQAAIDVIRAALGNPDAPATILSRQTWASACQVADRFCTSRMFLVGDAAHAMPPTGGQGGNTAIMDSFHLAWKLAAVLDGTAGPGLLESHDEERRPFADVLVEQQYAGLVERLRPGMNDETVAALIAPERVLFGYAPPTGAFVAEPGNGELFEDPAAPSGRPGTRAPHVVLPDGSSTRSWYGREFVVLAPPALHAPHVVPRIRHRPLTAQLGFAHGVSQSGAVLIRPDGVIAWRAADAAAPHNVADALNRTLGR
ncbi:FAD-dependent monooxygenase [Humibacter antri]